MTPSERKDLLKLLLHESAEARDDERYMFAQYAAIVSVAILILGAMATVFYTTCAAGYPGCPGTDKVIPISIWIYVGAPLLPIVLIGYGVFITVIQTLRSYYLRTLELKIHQLTGQSGGVLPIPSWAHIHLKATSLSRERRSIQINSWMIYGTISLMVLECLYLAFQKIPVPRYRVFALAIDGTLIAILISTVLNVKNGHELWHDALNGLPADLLRTTENFPESQLPPGERSLASFLLLPRNQEELLKALFIPISFAIGMCLGPVTLPFKWNEIWYPLGFFLVFEFIVYQARYLFNDLKDRYIDCRPGLSKRRFPCSLKQDDSAIKAAVTSIVARLIVAGLLVGCIFPYEHYKWLWHSGFLLGIFVFASLYEVVRSGCNAVKSEFWKVVCTWALVVAAGFGYGLRSVVGFWLAGGSERLAPILLLAAGASLFGSMFVALSWALESTRSRFEEIAEGKAHLLLFRKLISRITETSQIGPDPTKKVMAGRQFLLAPWSVFSVLATTALIRFVLYFFRDHMDTIPSWLSLSITHVNCSYGTLISVAVFGMAVAAVVSPIAAAYVLTLSNIVGLIVALHTLSVSIAYSTFAAVVSTLPLITMCIFRGMPYMDLPDVMNKLITNVGVGTSHLYKWFIKER